MPAKGGGEAPPNHPKPTNLVRRLRDVFRQRPAAAQLHQADLLRHQLHLQHSSLPATDRSQAAASTGQSKQAG